MEQVQQTKGAQRHAAIVAVLPKMVGQFTVADVFSHVKDNPLFAGDNGKAILSSTISKIPGVKVVTTKPNAAGKGKPCNVMEYKAA